MEIINRTNNRYENDHDAWMIYRHKNLVLDLNNSARAKLYREGRLLFIGDGYIAISMLLDLANHHPDVKSLFEKQLSQREKLRFNEESRTEKFDNKDKNWLRLESRFDVK